MSLHKIQRVRALRGRYTILNPQINTAIKPPARHGFEELISHALITRSSDPMTIQEATLIQEKVKWVYVL